ncbi:hypothetical protein [Rhizobium phaseoli]|uniref:hypothetical protein n=1 Tax=Rhizobium phaseoli TaxID=396 RepID=UPI0012370BC9|nr:hypothetical protein [Rhizobium phaseoli]
MIRPTIGERGIPDYSDARLSDAPRTLEHFNCCIISPQIDSDLKNQQQAGNGDCVMQSLLCKPLPLTNPCATWLKIHQLGLSNT